jgi:hypothetical protein
VLSYSSFRWFAGLFALMIGSGLCAVPALRAQQRMGTASPTRHWWDVASPTTPATLQAGKTPADPAGAAGEPIYRLQRDQRGESKALLVDADEIATWTEKPGSTEYCVFLVRGLVFVQQGVVQARFEQGVAWIDISRFKNTGKLRAEIYAQGKVRIDDGLAVRDYPRAILDLTTRGEFKVSAHRAPLIRDSRANDPLVLQGRAAGLGPRFLQSQNAAGSSPVQPVSFQRERNLILPPTVQPAPKVSPNLQPPPPLPRPPSSPSPSTVVPKSATLERTAYYSPPDNSSTASSSATGQPGAGGTTLPPPAQAGGVPGRPTALPGAGPQPAQPEGPATGSPSLPDGSVPPSGPTRVPPGTPPVTPPSQPTPPPPGKPAQITPNFIVVPRQGSRGGPVRKYVGKNGESIFIFTGGVMLQVRNANRLGMIDMEADRIVVWTRGNTDLLAENIQSQQGHSSNDLEAYLSGHVILRQAPTNNPKGDQRTISADEVYYDVNRNVAIARNGRLELKQPLMNDPVIATAKEIRQTSLNTFEMVNSEVFSSRLPSDPGLKVYLQDGVIEDRSVPLRNIFGLPVLDRKTGQPVLVRETWLTGDNTFFELEKIPFYWLPHVSTNVQEPLGPVQDFNFGWNHIFGIQFGVSLNLYELLGMQPRPATRWLLNLEYLSYRGPGIGTMHNTTGNDFFGIPTKYTSTLRAIGLIDRDFDILGGIRPVNNFNPTNFRGWALERATFLDMPYGFSFLTQISPVSDRNFIEQYYKRAWDLDPNFDTFGFLKQQDSNWEWTFMVRPRLRHWVTMTQDLPRFDGWLIGQDFFRFITYSSSVNAEYANLRISNDPLPQVSVTDQNDATFRGDWYNEVEVPFYLGPLKLSPYGMWHLTGYSQDLQGNSIGRSWEAGGVRASIPFTHVYSSVASELWNLNGLNHKVSFNVNYVYAYTNVPYTMLPQLDRLNTDAANQALRDIRPYQLFFNPNAVFDNHGLSLIFSPYYNTPQTMAIRRLLFERDIDTLSTVEQLQFQLSQRLQTKRGFPGAQHIVDWMTFDIWASYFPAYNRDNFGHPWSFLQYNYLWNVGDRTALTSTGWTDPFPGGVRMWTVGSYFNRPDRTNFYLGFRYIDPLKVRAVTASVTYIFSPKYAATASSTYDFGTGEAFANSLMFTRMGSDLQVSLGVSYNALQSNFNVLFNIVPNLLPANRAFGPMGAGGAGSQQGVLNSNF